MTVDVSIVVPCYNEEEGIPILLERVKAAVESFTQLYEIIFVDDGSTDSTLETIRSYAEQDHRVKAVSLSRNFGKEKALTAGLDFAKGRAIVPFDADLQDPPEVIGEMYNLWLQGYKVVVATRKGRPGDSWLKSFTARIFYNLINRVSTVKIPVNTGDFRLMDREVVEAVKKLPERTRFMKGIFAWVGFKTAAIYYDRPERVAGKSSWNYRRLWNLALDGIFSFTTVPLRIWMYVGGLTAVTSFSYAIYLIADVIMNGVDVPGYASLMVAVLFMGGVQLLSLGIIGEYVGRIYRETKQRPLYLVSEKIGLEE